MASSGEMLESRFRYQSDKHAPPAIYNSQPWSIAYRQAMFWSIADGVGMKKPSCAVLISGGLDSAVLLAEQTTSHLAVHPLFIESSFPWEAAELWHLRRFLDAIRSPAIQPLHILSLPVTDLYGDHWSLNGQDVPDASSPDSAVFLPGRNVLLLAKAMIWCHLHDVPEVALAVLAGNPFPDATPAFFSAYEAAVNQAVSGRVQVLRPFAGLKKVDVVRRGRELPLQLTFSCLQPQGELHCGRCNKCGERRRAFHDARVPDPTRYASETSCIV
jgi:7-cyano-7-deazaguanine synthase